MKVLHVIPAIAPRYGGPSSVIQQLCRVQRAQAGLEIEVVATDANGGEEPFQARGYLDSCPVHLLPWTASEQWKYSGRLRHWLHKNVHRFDLLHVHALWSYSSYAASRASIRAAVPYVVRPAGMVSEYAFRHHGFKKQLYWNLMEKRTVQGAAGFHSTSTTESRDILGVRECASVFCIANGVDEAAWTHSQDSELLRARCGIKDPNIPIALFLSRIHPKKGICDLLLPALANIDQPVHLAIVGGPDSHDPHHYQQMENEIHRLGLTQQVSLLGQIEGAERWPLFDGADFFVLPSHSENFGIVVAEAMGRGCPVIVTDGVQCCEHVLAADCGLITKRSVNSVHDAMRELLSPNAPLTEMGERGKAYARTHFAWESIADSILDMYRDIVSERSNKNT